MTRLGLEKSSNTNSESRSSIISPANSFPLNNLTTGISPKLLAPPCGFVTIPSLKTYPYTDSILNDGNIGGCIKSIYS